VGLALRCLQRLSLPDIATQPLPLARQLEDQRSVCPGPLVLRTASLQVSSHPREIETELSHAYQSTVTSGIDYIFILFQGVDVWYSLFKFKNISSFRSQSLQGLIDPCYSKIAPLPKRCLSSFLNSLGLRMNRLF